jgi:hypothetical protein
MKAILLYALCAAWTAPVFAIAPARLADIAIVDRDSGEHLPLHYRHGEYWVAGQPGARYAIYVRNRLPERLLAVTSVDGVNVITGQTAGWDQSGYVFDALEAYEITGWRKSDSVVAAFAFTAAPNSYAERTGRPENVGVIGLALYRERPRITYPSVAEQAAPARERAQPSDAARTPNAINSPLAASAPRSEVSRGILAAPAPLPGPALGTAHGDREASYVGHTTFDRASTQPDEVIRIRYDSHENLIAMGIIRPPAYPPPIVPEPFPGSAEGYVPDPPQD